jgi:hypothetical protein
MLRNIPHYSARVGTCYVASPPLLVGTIFCTAPLRPGTRESPAGRERLEGFMVGSHAIGESSPLINCLLPNLCQNTSAGSESPVKAATAHKHAALPSSRSLRGPAHTVAKCAKLRPSNIALTLLDIATRSAALWRGLTACAPHNQRCRGLARRFDILGKQLRERCKN